MAAVENNTFINTCDFEDELPHVTLTEDYTFSQQLYDTITHIFVEEDDESSSD